MATTNYNPGTNGHNGHNGHNGYNGHNGHNGNGNGNGNGKNGVHGLPDYYEFLQISPYAGAETIHRIYRYLASRYHPDNPETGNAEMFHSVRTAYDVLSNPDLRAQYDAAREGTAPGVMPLSNTIDFMDDIEGETNRRLALLAVLYARRRTNPRYPEVSLTEIESSMGFPRDYLDFTTWYLSRKGYITRADNADFTLTVDGVDYVEQQRARFPMLNKLLTSGQLRVPGYPTERRVSTKDRRVGAPDTRAIKIERRSSKRDRRVGHTDIRSAKSGVVDMA